MLSIMKPGCHAQKLGGILTFLSATGWSDHLKELSSVNKLIHLFLFDRTGFADMSKGFVNVILTTVD